MTCSAMRKLVCGQIPFLALTVMKELEREVWVEIEKGTDLFMLMSISFVHR